MEMLKAKSLADPDLGILEIGTSVHGQPLYAFPMGTGKRKVLMWSQMHGNESTTTKAVWDMVNFLRSSEPLATAILSQCRLMIVPMLNPDGALAYTRENLNLVDLNRDAQAQTQPESRAIARLFESFAPDHCFNLHDQRTLFGAGRSGKVATVSFLSPASDPERVLTPNRIAAMQLIAAMSDHLQQWIPGQIGRFDDGFNANCIGDTFQMAGVPTILFEAGHYPGDYDREKTREYIFHALLKALETIAGDGHGQYAAQDYFAIPENEKLFFDILVRDPGAINPVLRGQKLGIRYREELRGGKIEFVPEIADIGPLVGHFGHLELEAVDCKEFGWGIDYEKIVKLIRQAGK